MKNKFLVKNVILMMFFTLCYAHAQTGYIYVHKKAISEVASLDFPFTLTGPSSYSKTFNLNDKPDALNAFDLGNSHGAGEGQLWAVINDNVNDGSTHVTSGTLYTRPANSQQWAATSVTGARSVDGIDANTVVYSNNTRKVFLYNSSTNIITDLGDVAPNGSTIIDVASGGSGTGGLIVAVGSNGTLYRYSGGAWNSYSGTNVSNVRRVDVNPTNQDVVFIRANNQSVYRLIGGGALNAVPTTISAPAGTGSAGDTLRDIAISNNGTIYSNFTNSATGSANIYEYTSSWVDNPTSRSFSGITAGAGTQSWSINKVNPDQIKHSIFTSTLLSTSTVPGLWLDDERVRTTVANGNSIMIPIPAGTYTLKETVDPAWSNSDIKIYDPTSNSSSDYSTSTSTINVSAGEVVNVVYTNSLKNTVVIPAICGVNNIVTFGSGTALNGPAINGFTAYHYIASGGVSDGYYSVVKSKAAWYNNSPPVINHTGDSNGYYGIFNASYATDDFFRQTVTGLAPNTTYEFAFWVANLSASGTSEIKPNVTMGIDVGGVISSINTNDITSNNWIQYKFNFTTNSTITTSDTAEIFLKNNSIGGVGNDLAIDDVSFAPAPTVLVPSSGPTGITVLCSNTPTQYQFTNPQAGGMWSTTTPTLINIDGTGKVTTIANAVGTATVLYSYSSSSGCTSTNTININIGNCACYNLPNTASAGSDTQHGITLLNRAGETSSSWPMSRKSAFTVLESNTKGFVITRMSTTQIAGIASPQEGMMVYDTNEGCLKLYDGAAWSCFNTATCPE